MPQLLHAVNPLGTLFALAGKLRSGTLRPRDVVEWAAGTGAQQLLQTVLPCPSVQALLVVTVLDALGVSAKVALLVAMFV